jgi:crotonobetainyl-CoA:carnitine CoA-transferase CaiB-like acyl-CoA transferase
MKPLADFKVVSLAINIPGPVAAARLRDLGAAVTKIEPPGGDMMAWGSPSWYEALNRGIEMLALDLKSAEGKERLESYLSHSDLLLTSTRPDALERLGLGWAALSGRYPRLCQVAIVGYLPPDENKAGHDLTYQAGLGLVRPPHMPLTTLADIAGAERAVQAALGLLLARERGQVSGYEEVSLADAAGLYAEPLRRGLTTPGGALGGGLPGYGLYRARDGWIAVAALEPHFLQRLMTELGIVEMTQTAFAEAFWEQTADYWEMWAAEKDLPLVKVLNVFDEQLPATK